MDARSGGCSWLTLHPATPTDTSSCQQVLHSGSWQHVHSLEWRYLRWWVTQVSYPGHRGAGCGLSGRDHGCVAHRWRHPEGHHRARSMVRDGGAPTLLADSEAVSAVLYLSQSLQSVQHAHHISLWVVYCCLQGKFHARGDILHMGGPLGQAEPWQVNRS